MTVKPKNKDDRKKIYVIGILVALVIGMLPAAVDYVAGIPIFTGNVIHGYDGIVSEVVGVRYDPKSSSDQTDILYDGTSITIDEAYDNIGSTYPQYTETGLRCSVSGGVNIDTSTKVHDYTAPDAKYIVNEVKARMGMSIRTVPQGFEPASDITFTVQLKENDFSIFSDADEQYACILSVATATPPEVDKPARGIMETDHMEGGRNWILQPIGTKDPPDWVRACGYAGTITNYNIVNFETTVITAQPEMGFFTRTESEIVYDIDVMVLVFGQWEQTLELEDFENQPDPDPFGWLGEFSSIFGEGLNDMLKAGYLTIFVIVVFGLIVIYFFFVARRKRR